MPLQPAIDNTPMLLVVLHLYNFKSRAMNPQSMFDANPQFDAWKAPSKVCSTNQKELKYLVLLVQTPVDSRFLHATLYI